MDDAASLSSDEDPNQWYDGDENEDDETHKGYIFAFPERIFSNLCDRYKRPKFHSRPQQTQPAAKLSKIRLLQFVTLKSKNAAPGSRPAVTYRLREFEFGKHPAYAALSYVWGPIDNATDKTIAINFKPQRIRHNLSRALAVLTQVFADAENCDGDEPAYIWADAICINQEDGEEKSRVVPHMGQIYAHASRVYSYLSPSSQDSNSSEILPDDRIIDEPACEKVLSSLEALGEIFWQHSGEDIQRLTHESLDFKAILEKSLPVLISTISDSFPIDNYAKFSRLPYWSRIWVLQEVYQAQHLHFFCGPGRRFTSKHIIGGVLLVEAFRNHLLTNTTSPDSLIKCYPSLRRFALDNPASPEMHRLLLYTTVYDRSDMTLRIALTNFCIKELPHGPKAMDPRDMVFGLLGFATQEERGYIKADYDVDNKNAYMEATRALMMQGFTDVLAWSQSANKKLEHLPSWVPDFTGTIHDSLCSHAQAKPWLPRFNAGGTTPKYEYMVRSRTLYLSATYIDTIAEVGDLWSPQLHRRNIDSTDDNEALSTTQTKVVSHSDLLSFLRNVKQLCGRAQQLQNQDANAPQHRRPTVQLGNLRIDRDTQSWLSPDLPEPPAPQDSAWRVPCADQINIENRHARGHPQTQEMHAKLMDALPRCISDPCKNRVPAECRPYIEQLLRFVDKRVFVTERGYVGLGPDAAVKGDMVFVFTGLAAPYVAKRYTVIDGVSASQLMLSLVGEAYVDGLMDDEAAGAPRRAVGLV